MIGAELQIDGLYVRDSQISRKHRVFFAREVNPPVYNFVAWEVECVKIIVPEAS